MLVVGETIIDEYTYCEAIGKSGKEPVLASRFVGADRFGGGVLACANHLAGFVRAVDVLTQLGEGGDEEEFVRGVLKPNVTPIFLEKPGAPTIVKQRFVEKYLSQKMFEVYRMNDTPLDAAADAELCDRLQRILPDYDLVVVADYGHGMLSANAIDVLCRQSRFLAVNTQSNAGNHGFNMISKYPRADYVCLAQREVALETRNQQLTAEEMAEHVSAKLDCPRVMITRGNAGTLYHTVPDRFARVPALATRVVDRVGAGDAVLCVTALCAATDAHAGSDRLHRERGRRRGRRDPREPTIGRTHPDVPSRRMPAEDAHARAPRRNQSARRSRRCGLQPVPNDPACPRRDNTMSKPEKFTVLVTGGAGYVGSVLVPKLLADGHAVRVLDTYCFGTDVLAAVKGHPNLTEIQGDMRERSVLEKALEGLHGGHSPRVHLERPELRTRPGARQVDQL